MSLRPVHDTPDQPAPSAAISGLPARWHGGWRFLRLATHKARRDDLSQLSSSLAFITIVSLVPLLATGSSFAAIFFGDQSRLVEILGAVLPYSEDMILFHLSEYLAEARTIRGIGFLALLATSLLAFVTIERALNQVWNVDIQRPLSTRLRSFTLVLFWGPLVIGATYSSLFLLSERATISIVGTVLAQLIPFVVTLFGLTVLYWLVPYTKVYFSNALAGAVVAAILLEVLRRTIGLYLLLYQRISVIYGSFGLALLFMISIQLAWWLVMLGSEVAYCAQNRARLWRPRQPAAVYDSSWLGLASMAAVVERFRTGRPVMKRAQLAAWLALEDDELDLVVQPLIEGGILAPSSDGQGYLLSSDPYRVKVAEILGCYESINRAVLWSLPTATADRLSAARRRFDQARNESVGEMTLADLVIGPVETLEPATAGD